jgi:hypothetical protein
MIIPTRKQEGFLKWTHPFINAPQSLTPCVADKKYHNIKKKPNIQETGFFMWRLKSRFDMTWTVRDRIEY